MSVDYATATGYAKGTLTALAIKARAAATHISDPGTLKIRLGELAAECDRALADLAAITGEDAGPAVNECGQCRHAISAHNHFGCSMLNAPGHPWSVCLCARSQRELLCAVGQHDVSYEEAGCCDRCGTWAGARPGQPYRMETVPAGETDDWGGAPTEQDCEDCQTTAGCVCSRG